MSGRPLSNARLSSPYTAGNARSPICSARRGLPTPSSFTNLVTCAASDDVAADHSSLFSPQPVSSQDSNVDEAAGALLMVGAHAVHHAHVAGSMDDDNATLMCRSASNSIGHKADAPGRSRLSDFADAVVEEDRLSASSRQMMWDDEDDAEDLTKWGGHFDDDLDRADVGGESEHDAPPDDRGVEFDPHLFMSQLPPYRHVGPAFHARNASPALPAKRFPDRLDLVLDLDETLVHCAMDGEPQQPGDVEMLEHDFEFSVSFQDEACRVRAKTRPGLVDFLRRASRRFEITVFTASQRVYAEALLDRLDPEGDLVHHRLYRDSCLVVGGNFVKDLRHVFSARARSSTCAVDLSRVLLVDNSPHAFSYDTDNGVPIASWFDDARDGELFKLLEFLERADRERDVRPLVRSTFETHLKIIRAETHSSEWMRRLHKPVVDVARPASRALFQ